MYSLYLGSNPQVNNGAIITKNNKCYWISFSSLNNQNLDYLFSSNFVWSKNSSVGKHICDFSSYEDLVAKHPELFI